MASTLREGAALAAEAIDKGRAREKLEQLRSFCNPLRAAAAGRPAGDPS